MKDLQRIFGLLDQKERRDMYWLLVGIILTALLETAGIAAIAPFMAIVAKPSVIHSNSLLHRAYEIVGARTAHAFLFMVGFSVLLLLVIGNGLSALVVFLLYRFACMREHTLSTRLLETYLRRPYVYFLNRNTSMFSKNLLYEAHRIVTSVLLPIATVVSRSAVAVFVIALLFAVKPLLALAMAAVIGGTYVIMFYMTRRMLGHIGQEQSRLGALRYRVCTEALGGVKDIKVFGRESTFLKRYARYSRDYSRHTATAQLMPLIPKYAMETVAFGGIILMVLHLLGAHQNVASALPLIALYAFAGYRLLPAVQQIFINASAIKANIAALDALEADLAGDAGSRLSIEDPVQGRLSCKTSLAIRDITFTYPGAQKPTLEGIDLTISANSTVGFVGTTGSGKTTLADLILGLLSLGHGEITVDGIPINSLNVRLWRRNIGYIPQTIFLSDDTIAANIAFGIEPDAIDLAAVERAARIARLHDFIVQELPKGYRTEVGERGVRLSGGQRQRIGIARALYHDPGVLIMDEATSALDSSTESAVMEAIFGLEHSKTIIIIAHRLSTVRRCDCIHLFGDGHIVASGTFDELLASSPVFQRLVHTSTA